MGRSRRFRWLGWIIPLLLILFFACLWLRSHRLGDTVRWGDFSARVLHTPGHTPGSICLVVDSAPSRNRLIAGDTLFQGSIGRTDLWGGSYPQIIKSIREKLIVLPEEMMVYPGHGEFTTIGAERELNPFLR